MKEDFLKDKKRVYIIILSVLLVCLGGYSFYLKSDNQEVEEKSNSSDALTFKEEYESLNGTTNGDLEYLTVNISENNQIVYKTDEEIVDILESGTGIIYFGFNTCPWCRSMIETLLKSADTNNISTIYYVDIKNIRSTYTVEDNELVKTKNGTDAYYKILNLLDNYLSDYIVDDEYDTGEKRLYAPTVVVVKDGVILQIHEGTVDSMTNPYDGLTDDEEDELYKIYNEMLALLNDSSCNKNETGC